MTRHRASIWWSRGDAAFSGGEYSRVHEWRFDGGAVIRASASPQIVPAPHGDAAAVDPEEAFVAALSSCHMLWFLHLASDAGYVVDRYEDDAVGVLGKNAAGRPAVTRVTLRPKAMFGPARAPGEPELRELHHRAHEQCFLAASVLAHVEIEPQFPDVSL